jgi:hypothetical protein
LAAHKKKEVKSKWMMMDAIKDHLIPHITKKINAKDMLNALVGLYHIENINKKMILQNKFRSTQRTRLDLLANYLIKVTHIHVQLVVVGENIVNVELVSMALNGFPN